MRTAPFPPVYTLMSEHCQQRLTPNGSTRLVAGLRLDDTTPVVGRVVRVDDRVGMLDNPKQPCREDRLALAEGENPTIWRAKLGIVTLGDRASVPRLTHVKYPSRSFAGWTFRGCQGGVRLGCPAEALVREIHTEWFV
jgi:hypothetical protein